MLRPSLYVGALALLHTTTAAAHDHHHHQTRGAVFTLTNESEANRILAFARDARGQLAAPISTATEGRGSGDGLGSQGALVLSDDEQFLLAVNAGSADISVFAVHGAELELRSRVGSGGERPISITQQRDLVFVLNAGEGANVVGFVLDAHGELTPIADGRSEIAGGSAAAPAQVQLTPDARTLVVSEKAANQLQSFQVSRSGRLSDARLTASPGTTPFGFDISSRGDLVVSEAATQSASSFSRERDGTWAVISDVVSDEQLAPCWVTLTPDDRYAFVANAGSGSISSYTLSRRGELALLDARAGVLGDDSHALDLALTDRGHLLFALDRGRAVVAFSLDRSGTLERVAEQAGSVPEFSAGIAAY